MDLISVIVPIYNTDKYLKRCIESILAQTYKDIEVILVDDGSTDNSGEICDKYSENVSRIKVIHKENGGLSDARNAGIASATGKYIGFIDSDDYIEQTMYENLLKGITDNNADISCCGRFISSGKEENAMFTIDNEKVFSSDEAIKELLIKKVLDESACDKLYKKDLFIGIQYPYGEINEDTVTTPLLFQKSKKVVHVGLPLYHYCKRAGSITTSLYSKKDSIMYNHLIWLESFINKYYSNLRDYFLIYEYSLIFSMFSKIGLNKTVLKEYQNDYEMYRKKFFNDFDEMMSSKKVDTYIKIRAVLVRLNLYLPLKRFERHLKQSGQ